jgi:hypothetical protein
MSQRGRPKNAQPSVRIVLSGYLHPEHDADILAWWNAIPVGLRMNAFKTALRNGSLGLDQKVVAGELDELQTAVDTLLANWEF